LVGVLPVVAGRGKVDDAFACNGIDCLRHDAVLEKRLVEVADIVDYDGRAGVGECDDAVGEGGLPVDGGGKGGGRTRGDVVNDLHHGPAFVRERQPLRRPVLHAARFLQNVDGSGQIAVRLIEGRVIACEAVRRVALRSGGRDTAAGLVVDPVAVEAV